MQYVRVEVAEGRAYTYTFSGTPALKKGERVVLPSNMVQNKQFVGTVLRLMDGPDTDFPLKAIIARETEPLTDDDRDLL